MSSGRQIGKVSERRDDLEVEWTIERFYSYMKEDEYYVSPRFFVAGSNFYLQIYPYGENRNKSVGWISLYLVREDNSSCRTSVNCTFGVKKAGGTFRKRHSDISWVFDERNRLHGYPFFLWSWQQVQELAPAGTLTLNCTLRVNHGFDTAESSDTLSQNFKNAFLCEKYSDVTLKVKNETFPVHKFVLAARSPVFDAMFAANMEEKYKSVVNIVDCNPKLFKDFLVYVYSGKLNNISSNAFELYKIANKYQVNALKKACVGSIECNLSEENVCNAILLVHQFGESDLKIKTQDFFNANLSKIISSAAWESLLEENYCAADEFLNNAGKMTDA